MAYGLPYKHDTSNLINPQLEIDSQATFAREQDRLEMIRILHAARVESGNGKSLDLEILLNQIGGFKYLNPMKRRQKMTIHCKRRYRPRLARQISRIGERPHLIVMGSRIKMSKIKIFGY